MSGLIESAAAILSASESRLEVAAHNVSNISTPEFKRQVGFSQLRASRGSEAAQQVAVRRDFTQGKLTSSTNPLDIAISGEGFFQLRAGDAMVYSRQGQFSRAADGSIVPPQGSVLQQAGGGGAAPSSCPAARCGCAKTNPCSTAASPPHGPPCSRRPIRRRSSRSANRRS